MTYQSQLSSRCTRTQEHVFFVAIFAAFLLQLSGATLAQSWSPTEIEHYRGKVWSGKECCGWTFVLQQRSGPHFSGAWNNRNGQRMSSDDVLVNLLPGRKVQIVRQGGSAAGGCTYDGTISLGRAGGRYACAGRDAGDWSSVINER